MKFIALMLTVACLIACDDARVISADGKVGNVSCQCTNWIKCINDTCPYGYDIVDTSMNPAIIRCKVPPPVSCKQGDKP